MNSFNPFTSVVPAPSAVEAEGSASGDSANVLKDGGEWIAPGAKPMNQILTSRARSMALLIAGRV